MVAGDCLEVSSPTITSSIDNQAMDVAVTRPRWKKALSLGSMTSSADTERCTDLEVLDMEALAADGTLTLNSTTGGFSGWVHVATSRSGQVTFMKRFCRLEELVCKFYASKDVDQRVQPVGRHVIISVNRVHSRNKTFTFTDYEDRKVLLHTCIGADFEHWYGTFARIVKATLVAKTRRVDDNRRVSSRGGRRHPVDVVEAPRLRAVTAPMSFSALKLTSEKKLSPVIMDEDPERTHTVWLYIQAPWWYQLLLRRRRMRRYFVFSGTNVSYFSVNKEGKRASFTHTITSCLYNSEQDPTVVVVGCGHSHRKLRLGTNDGTSAIAATAKYIQRALDADINE